MEESSSESEQQICSAYQSYRTPGLLSNLKQPSNLLAYDLPRIHLQLAMIFTLTNSLHFFLFRHLLLPRVISEIMAGIILGPTILGRIGSFEETLFPISGDIFLNFLSRMGFIFFIFLWGVKMDPKMMLKTGWRGWVLGVAAFMLPLTGGVFLMKQMKKTSHSYKWKIITYVTTTHCFVSFPMVASILVHLNIMNTEVGHLACSISLISNLLSITFHIVAFSLEQGGVVEVLQYFLPHVWLLLFIVMIVKPLSHWMIKQTPGSKPVKTVFIIIVSTLVLVTVLIADHIGVPHEVGAFLVGLIGVPDGPPLGSSLVKKLETLVDGLLAPLMVSCCGTKVNLTQLYDLKFIGKMWILVGCCLVIKVTSFIIPALLLKVPTRDTLTLAFVMSSQGIVQISSHLFLFTIELYDQEAFTMMVLAVLLIAAIMDTLPKFTYDYSFTYTGYRKRTIQHQGDTGELTILACIYRFDDVFPVRNLLQVSMVDQKSPVSVSVLNLVELVGRATPQLIDHKFGHDMKLSGVSRSQELLDFFIDFEHKYKTLLHIHLFSAISMYKFMHQDICALAFKHTVSFIIIPFHRKWNHQGKLILDNNNFRDVNCKVLDMAPCSVGILIERQMMQQHPSSSQDVAVIFLGGSDDIEALSYGKRIARTPGVRLTVVHLVESENSTYEQQWNKMLDAEALRELKVTGDDNVVYRKVVVEDGADTAVIIHELEKSCDLILTGRRHEEYLPQLWGLTEWSEFPELGHIGDVMATSDIHKPLSVLIVQQQTIRQK